MEWHRNTPGMASTEDTPEQQDRATSEEDKAEEKAKATSKENNQEQ